MIKYRRLTSIKRKLTRLKKIACFFICVYKPCVSDKSAYAFSYSIPASCKHLDNVSRVLGRISKTLLLNTGVFSFNTKILVLDSYFLSIVEIFYIYFIINAKPKSTKIQYNKTFFLTSYQLHKTKKSQESHKKALREFPRYSNSLLEPLT